MATLSELLNELQSLPIGNVYEKRINGKTYYYHQYFLNGVRYSRILKKNEVEEITSKIAHRKEIEKLIKSIKLKNVTLSKNANELTGFVMNGNEEVAKFEKGVLVSLNEKHAPLVIVRTHSIEEFLKLRVIDMSRTNARILKKVLNIEVDEDYKTPLYSYALSISDQYWFKPKNSKLKYHDVNFDNDSLFETSLKGEVNVFFHKAKLSPEITTTGSFEKGWKYIDNEWWLYKQGNNKQIFSELFCSRFAELIGINTVKYEYDGNYIFCKNFSSIYNYEPIASVAGDNDNYEHVFNALFKLNANLLKDYLRLMFFDCVINNIDRHNENLGVLRDAKTGRIVSLAPNFDNNLALIATTNSLNNNPKKDGFINSFISFLKNNEIAKGLYKENRFKDISIEEVENIVSSIPIDVENKDKIAESVVLRYSYLKNIF